MAITFANATDRAVINNSASPTAFTLAVGYQRTGAGSSGRLLTKGSATELFGVFFASSNNIIEFSMGRGGGGIAGSGASLHYILTGTDTAKHQLVMSYDASSTANVPTWYVDKNSVSNNSANAGTGAADTNTNGWNVGGNGTNNVVGIIDFVAVWSLARSDIATIAAALFGGESPLAFPQGLVLYDPMLGPNCADLFSGNATIAGATTGTTPLYSMAPTPMTVVAGTGQSLGSGWGW